MASIIFFEVDLLRQLEILKGRFDQIKNYSHISMFKELDKDGDGQVKVSDIVSFMQRTGYETSKEDAGNILRRFMYDISSSSNIESFCIEEFVNFMMPLQGSSWQQRKTNVKERTTSLKQRKKNLSKFYETREQRTGRMVPVHDNKANFQTMSVRNTNHFEE